MPHSSSPRALAALAALAVAAGGVTPAAAAPTADRPHRHGPDGSAAVLPDGLTYEDWHDRRHADAARGTLRAAAVDDPNDFTFLGGATPHPRWNPCDYIDYRITLDGAPRDGFNYVVQGVHKIAAATGLRFRYQGLSSFVPSRAGGRTEPGTDLTLAWADRASTDMLSDGAAGFGGANWTTGVIDATGARGAQIRSGFVALDAEGARAEDSHLDSAIRTGDAAWAADLSARYEAWRLQLAMHELGHAVGLGHAGGTAQIMYPVATSTQTEWGQGDLTGLSRVGAANPCFGATAAQAAAATVPPAVPQPSLLPSTWPVREGAPSVPALPAPAPAPVPAPPAVTVPPVTPPVVSAPPAAPAPAPVVRPTITGPDRVTRGQRAVLRLTGRAGDAYAVYFRAAGQKTFSRLRTGRLGADGRAVVTFTPTKDHRWYAEVGPTKLRTRAGLTKVTAR